MNITIIIGWVIAFGMVVFGIFQGGQMDWFIDPPSLAITIGGTIGCLIASYPLSYLAGLGKRFKLVFMPKKFKPEKYIDDIVEYAKIARGRGLLALEEAANGIEDGFLKKGILLIVDGTDPELVRAILETDMMCLEDRHKNVISFWEKWAEMGPAWGMIGTLIGLVNMLNKLDDPSSIGPQMAVALITTLYGSLIANWLCNPVAAKLKVNNDLEVIKRQITIEGLLSIQAGENPRVIEEKLKSFLTPASRELLNGSDAGGEE